MKGLLVLLVLVPSLGLAQPRRVAVLVGANSAASGRSGLQYAYRDAQAMADVLTQVGGFDPRDVVVLRDPRPGQVLDALDTAAAQLEGATSETLLLFYYSGHADQTALYPQGAPLPLLELRKRLDATTASVRVGIIDACSGGAWTRAKGLTRDAPFEVEVPFALTSEGSALIASSSGAEAAHETDAFLGSFFTHHFVAGLRGAADQSGDGEVTLSEAFAYARELTVRDTALQTDAPQHPSFELRLRGRVDLPLARVAESTSLLSLRVVKGPLQLVHLQTGVVVLEVPAGARTLLLALPPGRYVLRRSTTDGVSGREVTVEAQQSTQVDEASLVAASQALDRKEVIPPPFTELSTVPRFKVQARLLGGFIGYRNELGGLSLPVTQEPLAPGVFADFHVGLTSRLQLGLSPFPVLAYRWGARRGVEWVPWLGAPRGGLSFSAAGVSTFFTFATGLAVRVWLREHALNLGVLGRAELTTSPGVVSPATWGVDAFVGLSAHLASRVTLNVAVAWRQNVLDAGRPLTPTEGAARSAIGIGSVQSVALRRLALLSVQLFDWLAVELHASSWLRLGGEPRVEVNGLVGFALQGF